MEDVAIRFDGVSKRFPMTTDRPQSILETLISIFRPRRGKDKEQDLWALKDISFTIKKGETVGFVGTNGSGKSTMLKLAARIVRPTSGEIEVNGRVSALLELGAGFHGDLTGRENIYLSGSLMGLSNAEVEACFQDVHDFSELGNFIDVPVKHYSSGMYMRLAFSLAIHVSPDILFIDEILAVGDQAFQNKCFDRLHQFKRSEMTIVMVSHDLRSLQNICERLIWINRGEIMLSGEPRQVLSEYTTFSRKIEQDKVLNALTGLNQHKRWGSGEIKAEAVRLLDKSGKSATTFKSNEPMLIEIDYVTTEPIDNPQFGLAIFRQGDGVQMNSPNSITGGLDLGMVAGEGTIRYCIETLPLLPNTYSVTISIHDKHGVHTFDYHDQAYTFQIAFTDRPETHGFLSLPARWEQVKDG